MEKVRAKLICSVCLKRNYFYIKNKNKTNKVEIKKYCSHCEKHIVHKETR